MNLQDTLSAAIDLFLEQVVGRIIGVGLLVLVAILIIPVTLRDAYMGVALEDSLAEAWDVTKACISAIVYGMPEIGDV